MASVEKMNLSLPILQRKHIIQFETTLSLEEFSDRIWQLVDFNHHSYRSTALITKDFYGDQLGPGKFGIRRKPCIPGLFDVFAGTGPYVEIEFKQGRVRLVISHGSYLPHLIVMVVLMGLTFGYVGEFLPELSVAELILFISIVLGFSAIIAYLLNGRYRSVIRMVKRKLIENLTE